MKILCLIYLLFNLSACQENNQKEQERLKNLNLKLPQFSAIDVLSNLPYTKNSFVNPKSKGIYLHFWATWCGPCELEFPEFIKHARKFENKNLHFITIAVNDKPEAIKKYLKKYGKLPSNMTVFLDPDQLSLKFGTTKLPETFLLDKKGKFYTKFIGPQNWTSNYFSQQLENFFLK
jgi:cytochrome c biogenesis protein CcmG, thiol:disulfide interchange protein DsbE